MADDPWKDAGEKKRSLASLTQEVRAKLIEEYAALIDASDLSADEALVLVHILTHAGCSEDGSFFLPALGILWGAQESYIPPVGLPRERLQPALKFLRRRGILKEVELEPSLDDLVQTPGVVIDRAALVAAAKAA